MVWVKLDDHFDEHPKLAAVGPLGLAMWTAALAYCNRNLTDGFVPRSVAHTLVDWQFEDGRGITWQIGITGAHAELASPGYDVGPEMVLDLLVGHNLFNEVPGGYRVHDYLEYQPSKEKVLAERARERGKKRKQRARKVASPTMSPGDSPGDSRGSPAAPVPVVKDLKVKNTVAAARLFDHWKSVWGHPRAILTPARTRLVETRMREGYDEDTLRAAIDGSKADEKRWPDRANPSAHTFDLILRDAKHVETFSALVDTNGSVPGQKGFAPRTASEREQHRAALLAQREGQR